MSDNGFVITNKSPLRLPAALRAYCLGLFDTCPCDATALRVAQT
jgi:hypothetical protein